MFSLSGKRKKEFSSLAFFDVFFESKWSSEIARFCDQLGQLLQSLFVFIVKGVFDGTIDIDDSNDLFFPPNAPRKSAKDDSSLYTIGEEEGKLLCIQPTKRFERRGKKKRRRRKKLTSPC